MPPRRTPKPPEMKKVTLTVGQWRVLVESWAITRRMRGIGGKITREMAVSLDALTNYVGNKTATKRPEEAFEIEATRDGWIHVIDYVWHVPSAARGFGSDLARQVGP